MRSDPKPSPDDLRCAGSIPAPSAAVAEIKVDLRSTRGKRSKAEVVDAAIKLREAGWTIEAIARGLGVGPASVSMMLPLNLRTMKTDSTNVSDLKRARQLRAMRREREAERRAAHRERVRRQAEMRRSDDFKRWQAAYKERQRQAKASRPMLSVEERRELDELMASQAREADRAERGWGERLSGSKSPSMTVSLDALMTDDYGKDRLDMQLTSRMDFTAFGDLEHMMVTNGVTNTGDAHLWTGRAAA